MAMSIKIWGSRGSLPAPYKPEDVEKKIKLNLYNFFAEGNSRIDQIEDFLKKRFIHDYGGYGGNTLNVEINTPKSQILIDGGSGIRLLGYELLKGRCGKGSGEAHIFFTHFHWDHISGLPFFVPLFIPGNKIHVYAVQKELEEMFHVIFKKPYFPVELKDIGAEIIYHQLNCYEAFKLNDVSIIPFRLDHPDPCYGYRLEYDGKALSHCVDTEAKRVAPNILGQDAHYYQNLDLMLFDAQYITREKYEKIDWGHASATMGLDLAMNFGIKKVIFTHHDPASTDEKIFEYEQEAREYYKTKLSMAEKTNRKLHSVDWSFAYDGMEIIL